MRNFRPMETQKDAFAQVLLVRGRCYLSHLTTNVLGGVLVRRNCGDARRHRTVLPLFDLFRACRTARPRTACGITSTPQQRAGC